VQSVKVFRDTLVHFFRSENVFGAVCRLPRGEGHSAAGWVCLL